MCSLLATRVPDVKAGAEVMTPAWERTSTARAPYVCIFRHKEQRRPCTVWSTWNKKIGIKQKLNSNYVKMIKDVGGW